MFGHSTVDNSVKSKRCYLVAVILAIIGFLLVVAGVCMPFWYSNTDVNHIGVFQSCVWAFKECESTQSDSNDVYWGLAISGMIALLISMIFLCTYPVRKTVDHCKIALGICVSLFWVIGVALILALMSLYVTDSMDLTGISVTDLFTNNGFAWYLTLSGLILLVAGLIVFILHMFFMVYD